MKPWDIFRQGAGCLALIVTFCVGAMFGWLDYWWADTSMPYIDRATAARYAGDYARESCSRENHEHPVDCSYPRFKAEIENKDGWYFTFWSPDGRQSIGMIVDRRGKTEGEDPRDVDDPRWRVPDKPPAPGTDPFADLEIIP